MQILEQSKLIQCETHLAAVPPLREADAEQEAPVCGANQGRTVTDARRAEFCASERHLLLKSHGRPSLSQYLTSGNSFPVSKHRLLRADLNTPRDVDQRLTPAALITANLKAVVQCAVRVFGGDSTLNHGCVHSLSIRPSPILGKGPSAQ